jgi:hypothetical protein
MQEQELLQKIDFFRKKYMDSLEEKLPLLAALQERDACIREKEARILVLEEDLMRLKKIMKRKFEFCCSTREKKIKKNYKKCRSVQTFNNLLYQTDHQLLYKKHHRHRINPQLTIKMKILNKMNQKTNQ